MNVVSVVEKEFLKTNVTVTGEFQIAKELVVVLWLLMNVVIVVV